MTFREFLTQKRFTIFFTLTSLAYLSLLAFIPNGNIIFSLFMMWCITILRMHFRSDESKKLDESFKYLNSMICGGFLIHFAKVGNFNSLGLMGAGLLGFVSFWLALKLKPSEIE